MIFSIKTYPMTYQQTIGPTQNPTLGKRFFNVTNDNLFTMMALSLFSSTTHHIFVKLLQQTLQKNLLSVGDVNKSELTVHIPPDPTKLSCKAPLHREILFLVPKLTFTLWWRITETCHEVSPCCMEDAPSTAGVACTGIGAGRAVRLDEKDETWAGWDVVDSASGFPCNFLFPELHLPTNQSVERWTHLLWIRTSCNTWKK